MWSLSAQPFHLLSLECIQRFRDSVTVLNFIIRLNDMIREFLKAGLQFLLDSGKNFVLCYCRFGELRLFFGERYRIFGTKPSAWYASNSTIFSIDNDEFFFGFWPSKDVSTTTHKTESTIRTFWIIYNRCPFEFRSCNSMPLFFSQNNNLLLPIQT